MAKHDLKGRKCRRCVPYVATVEGEERGVPFRVFYKYMASAEKDAIKTGGIITDLSNLSRRRWVNNEWREC